MLAEIEGDNFLRDNTMHYSLAEVEAETADDILRVQRLRHQTTRWLTGYQR